MGAFFCALGWQDGEIWGCFEVVLGAFCGCCGTIMMPCGWHNGVYCEMFMVCFDNMGRLGVKSNIHVF